VAALLPYGYRTKFTAATWSDSASKHRFRLAFAARPRDGAYPIAWGAPAEPGVDGLGVREYLTQLDRLRARAAQNPHFDLPSIIAYLASDSRPRAFEGAGEAVGSLRSMELPFTVLEAVRQGTASRAAVRSVFTDDRVTELPPDGRLELLAHLVTYGDPEDWPEIGRWWGPILGEDPAPILPVLVGTCRQLLWVRSPSREVDGYLTLAANHGLEDDLLAGLVRLPQDAAAIDGGLSYAAQLVLNCIQTAGPFPETLRALRDNPLVACELLAQLAGSDQDPGGPVRWLRSAMPALVAPFAVVFGAKTGTVDRNSIGQLAGHGDGCVRALLEAASNLSRLDRVLPGFLGWLAAEDEREPAVRQYWHDRVWALRPAEAMTRAFIDVALLVLGFAPSFLLMASQETDWPVYLDQFERAWSAACPPHGRCDGNRLSSALAGYLARQRWSSNPAQAKAVVEVTRWITRDAEHPALVAMVESALAAAPQAAEWGFAQAWLAEVRRDDPATAEARALAALGDLPAEATPDVAAQLCARALQDGARPEAAGRVLAQSGAVTSGPAAVHFVNALRAALGQAVTDPETRADWLCAFAAMIAAGDFGETTAAEFQDWVRRTAPGELRHYLDLLTVIARGGTEGPARLNDEELWNLQAIKDSIDALTGGAPRPGRRWNWFHRRDGGEPPETDLSP
jgi:hypothetical protein